MSPHPIPTPTPAALIAEDEPLLAAALRAALAQVWPELQVLTVVGDGHSAVAQALALQPDVLFFDIRMPGQSGLEAANELADEWPSDSAGHPPFPALVFLTAYEQYAVQAFEAQAMDYLLKPLQLPRLQKAIQKVQLALAKTAQPAIDLEATLGQLRGLLAGTTPVATAPLKVIQVSVGSHIRLIPVGEVLYFEAADKYLRVLTAEHEYLIRTPLKELLPQLDASVFWQIHRGTVVRALGVDTVGRDDTGKLSLTLRGRTDKLPVSRLYAHRFKAM
jgi:DNA-binding LytR/AlgR family response regulator